MDIFAAEDYRQAIRGSLELKPRKGFGQLALLAEHLDVNASFVSQMLAGGKNLSEDQGFQVAGFLDFSETETAYFLLLIQRERAANHRLKSFYTKQITERRRQARRVKGRLDVDRELDASEQAVFYSDYLYAAVHSAVAIKSLQNVDALAQALGASRSRISEIVDWLVEHRLCKGTKEHVTTGSRVTYIDRDSPLVLRHHGNWRQRAVEVMRTMSEENFFFTASFSVAQKDYDEVRREIGLLIERIGKRVEKSDPDTIATINIDLFHP